MIIVQELTQVGKNLYRISAFSDTKEEVTSDATFTGLPYGGAIAMGSSILTASGEVAFRKSDDTWNWV